MPDGGFRFEPLQPGDPLRVGQYELRARLGAGGMGRVFLAFTPGGQAIAIKVVKPELARDPQFAQRFSREVRTAQRVSGSHLAQLLDADPEGREPWLASIYVAGPSLDDLVKGTGPLSVQDTLAISIGIARALESIHDAGVVHRDLKAANVMLDEAGPKVIDFGIVKSFETKGATDYSVTRIGTLPYMSPEQALGRPVSPSSDVFALGSTIFFLATSRLAFDAENDVAMAYRIVNDEPDLTTLDPQLHGLVSNCLKKDPSARPSVAAVIEMAQAEFGPLQPGAYLNIARATTAIRERTRALHKLAGEARTGQDQETVLETAAPAGGQPRAEQNTITARRSIQRAPVPKSSGSTRAGARPRLLSTSKTAMMLGSIALIAVIAIMLPSWLTHNSSRNPSALTTHSSTPSGTPSAQESPSFTGYLANPCDAPSSSTLGGLKLQLQSIYKTGTAANSTIALMQDCMWDVTSDGTALSYQAVSLMFSRNERGLPEGSPVAVVEGNAIESGEVGDCVLTWDTSFGEVTLMFLESKTGLNAHEQNCAYAVEFADAIADNVPR